MQDQTARAVRDASKRMAEQWRELKELLDEGILTQDEFDAQKKNILDNRS